MAWHTTHSITAKNAKGQNSVFKLQQDLGSAPASVKVLPILSEPVVNFAFSNDMGEGVLNFWTELTLLNNYDDDLLDTFLTNDENDFRLIIEIHTQELFRGKLDLRWNERKVLRANQTAFEFKALFTQGFSGSDTDTISDILVDIAASANTEHTYNNSTTIGAVIFADLWGEFVFENLCGYDTTEILIAHGWESESFYNPSGTDVQFRKMRINPAFMGGADTKRKDWFKGLCRAFAICAGYSWKNSKPVLQDVRKGSGGDYDAIPLTKVSDGFRTQGAAVTLEEQTGLQWLDGDVRAPIRGQYSQIEVYDRDETLQVTAVNNDPNAKRQGALEVNVLFDPTEDAEVSGGQRYGISVRAISSWVPADQFRRYRDDASLVLGSLFRANAFAQGSYSRSLPNEENVNYKGELNDLVDPMLPVKIGEFRYRIAKGELNTLKITTNVLDSVLISNDDTNFTIS